MSNPSRPPFRVGVAGCGSIGRNHVRVVAELAAASQGSLVFAGIHDADPARAAELSSLHGVPILPDLDAFANAVDAATVAVPTVFHKPLAEVLLARGRHVLVDKPITESLPEAQHLIHLAEAHHAILQVGHIERFNPVLRQLEDRLNAPRFIETHRLSPFPNRSIDIGVVLDLMIHDLEIILHLVDSPIAHIDAVGIPVLTRREDIANARIRFENGAVANVTASRISPEKMRKIRVFQSDAYLSLDYQDQSGWIYRKNGLEIAREEVQVEKDEPLKRELASFIDCAARGGAPKVSGEHGARALDVALEITRIIEAAK